MYDMYKKADSYIRNYAFFIFKCQIFQIRITAPKEMIFLLITKSKKCLIFNIFHVNICTCEYEGGVTNAKY